MSELSRADGEPRQTREPEVIGGRDLTDWRTEPGRRLVGIARSLAVRFPRVGRVYGWSVANVAFVLFAVVALGVALVLVKGTGEVYESIAANTGISLVDQPVLDLAIRLRTPALDTAVTWFTDIGGPVGMPVLTGIVTAGLAIRWRSWLPVAITAIAAVGSLLMTVAGKGIIGRARPPFALAVPPYETSPSFPSGHTLNATVLTTVVAYLVLLRTTAAWQRVVVIVLGGIFVLSMGLSRVYLGHHWLTDVIAGWAIGLAWSLAVITAHRLFLTLRPRRPVR